VNRGFQDIFTELLDKMSVTASDVSKATGMSQGLLSDYKKGRSIPTNKNLQKLSDFFGVSTDYLLTGQEINPTELTVPDELKNVKVAFHRGEFEDLTQGEVDKLAEFANFIKSQRSNK